MNAQQLNIQHVMDMKIDHREEIIRAAKAFYDHKMPYHNFDHIREVLSASNDLLEKCRQESIPVNRMVVFYALLFHDAGFHENHLSKGFETKEEYSAHLAETVLQEFQISESITKKVKQAIICTHQLGKCVSNEDKIVKNSDISGLAADYSEFRNKSQKLREEYRILNNQDVQWSDWTKMVEKKLEFYLDKTIFLTSNYFAEDGRCLFIENTRNNIRQLLADSS